MKPEQAKRLMDKRNWTEHLKDAIGDRRPVRTVGTAKGTFHISLN